MSSTLINGIGELVTCDGTGSDLLGVRSKTALVVEDDKIAWIGAATETPPADTMIDVDGRAVIPGFVDSHSHTTEVALASQWQQLALPQTMSWLAWSRRGSPSYELLAPPPLRSRAAMG
jgi:imidazolonepropionase-like amidohydrolase